MKKNKKSKLIETIIGKETVIEGKITLPTSLRIDGKVLGEVFCEGDVYIGKHAYVEPFINAKNVIIAGEVKGDIVTSEKIKIESNGKLNGNITSKGIVIEDGGIFIGTSSVFNEEDLNKALENHLSGESV